MSRLLFPASFQMNEKILEIVDKLYRTHHLEIDEYALLISSYSPELKEYVNELATLTKEPIYHNEVYIRGLIEISNICKNDCYYCGIRRSNKAVERYRLDKETILASCAEGHVLGFRTFVLQGGEDGYYTDEVLVDLIKSIKAEFSDCAVTLSLGERSYESYKLLFEAGADRYLLRHETADKEHYEKLHPKSMSFENRMNCLRMLKEIGYQVGCGFMVGSPYQTTATLAKDLKFVEEFSPDMCGIGPFIPHKETIFKDHAPGTSDFTCYLLSILRLIKPNMLIPSTTALGTIDKKGREKGILAGANVVMPNLSPTRVRKQYELYDNKICTGDESAQCRACLNRRIESVQHTIVTARGDIKISK